MELRFRLAEVGDLPGLKAMYGGIVQKMERDGMPIWDDVYPACALGGDVERGQLYVVTENGAVVSAFALSDFHNGTDSVQWTNRRAGAVYLDRLGVRADASRRGVGARAVEFAAAVAREKGAEFLRLFVVAVNRPAMDFYEKNGFVRVGGCYEEIVDESLALCEFGFELTL